MKTTRLTPNVLAASRHVDLSIQIDPNRSQRVQLQILGGIRGDQVDDIFRLVFSHHIENFGVIFAAAIFELQFIPDVAQRRHWRLGQGQIQSDGFLPFIHELSNKIGTQKARSAYN